MDTSGEAAGNSKSNDSVAGADEDPSFKPKRTGALIAGLLVALLGASLAPFLFLRETREPLRELSAYLAELVTEHVSPKLALVHVMPFLTSRAGSSLNFVVHLELQALAPERHEAALSEDPRAIFDELAALLDAEPQKRARAAYGRLFGADLADVK